MEDGGGGGGGGGGGRGEGGGGGVLCYDKLCSTLFKAEADFSEAIRYSLETRGSKIIVGVVYRCPSS